MNLEQQEEKENRQLLSSSSSSRGVPRGADGYHVFISQTTWHDTVVPYFNKLKSGEAQPGYYLQQRLLQEDQSMRSCDDNMSSSHHDCNDDGDDNDNGNDELLERMSSMSIDVEVENNNNITNNNNTLDDYNYKLLHHLINTKKPQIFAESSIVGGEDGLKDWKQIELEILGDISMVLPVTVYDNGRHRCRSKDVHNEPFQATLIYVPGALLNGTGYNKPCEGPCDWDNVTNQVVAAVPCDWDNVTNQVVAAVPPFPTLTEHHEGMIDTDGFYQLYERRILPPLLYINEMCKEESTRAFITIPGLGCGCFAGEFSGRIGQHLNKTLQNILLKHSEKLPYIKAMYYDPYGECQNERYTIGHIAYLVRPLLQSKTKPDKPQLCRPTDYEEDNDDFSDCKLFSFVAWDHVSWPGNDYWVGSRQTDDGVKAAATDTMRVMTNIEGEYNKRTFRYEPPTVFRNWDQVVSHYGVEIQVQPGKNFHIM